MADAAGAQSQYWAAWFIGVLAVGGFGAMFAWAWATGQFRNIEEPKRRMLELDRETEVRVDD